MSETSGAVGRLRRKASEQVRTEDRPAARSDGAVVAGPAAASPSGLQAAKQLQDLFGPKLTALMVGVQDPIRVADWARGATMPEPAVEQRLLDALRVAQMLLDIESREAVRGWFMGTNPDLDNRAPAQVIAEDPLLVEEAARIFLASG